MNFHRALYLNVEQPSVFSTESRPTLGPSEPRIRWVLITPSQKIKRQEHKADHSPPSSAEVKNGGDISPFPHTSSWCGT
jgi:hypothetical protein